MPSRKLIISAALLFCPLSAGLAVPAGRQPDGLVPDREVVLLDHGAPVWKRIWDEARNLARAGKFNAAITQYEALLLQKTDLEEARWELARIHLHTGHWDEAATILELLVEANPSRPEYLSSLGRVMLEKGRFERAEDSFRHVHEQDPSDVTALSGLADALLRLGRKREALPCLEQLHRLQPEDLAVHRKLALLAYDLGLYDKARGLLVDLAEHQGAAGDILVLTAQVLDRLGQTVAAAEYWQRVVANEPGNQQARMRLAEIFEGSGNHLAALTQLLAFYRQDGGDAALSLRIGRLYEKTGQAARALPYYEAYLQGHASDTEVLRAMVKIQAALGDKDKTLAALEKYFRVKKDSGPEDLKLAAQLYDAAGRLHEAIPLYRQLIESSPEDQELLTALASDLLAIGENEGALSTWKHLSRVTDRPLPVYRAMAELLTRLGRDDELIEVLEAIHDRDPADLSCAMRLAGFYLERGQLDRAGGLFAELASAGYQSVDFFRQRGRLFEELGRPEAALNDYLAYLKLQPGDAEVRLAAASLAGQLGRFSLAQTQLGLLAGGATELTSAAGGSLGRRFASTRILRESGFFDEAIAEYRSLLAAAAKGDREADAVSIQQLWLDLAETYQAAGLIHEAGQVLREAILSDFHRMPYLLALFELALATGVSEEAAAWLAGVHRELAALHDKAGGHGKEALPDWQVELLDVRSLNGLGEERTAIKKCRQLLSRHPAATLQPAVEHHDSLRDKPRPVIGLVLVRLLFDAGKLDEAREVGLMLKDEGLNTLELRVLLQQIDRRGQGEGHGLPISAQAVGTEPADLGDLLHLASIYGDYRDWHLAQQTALAAASRAPDSLPPRFLLAAARQSAGQAEEALALYQEILREYPGNTRAQTEVLKLLYRTGRFAEALALADTVLASQQQRPDILLIKARILWTRHNEKESVAIYQAMIEPLVGEALAQKLADMGITLELKPRRTWWDRITFSPGRAPELAEVVMAPGYLLDQGKQNKAVSTLAAPLYSRYQWQGLFSRELAARISVQDRQYNQAAHQYEALIEKGSDPESLLFDLAGIYSRLGRLGEEAALYERLRNSSPAFPGLSEAEERNRLKRRPQVALGYGYLEEDGWDNHKALERKWGEVSAQYSPLPQHEFEFSGSRINYQSTKADQKLTSRRAVLHYSSQVFHGLTAAAGVGVEKFEEDLPDTEVFSFSVLGKIGDTLKGRVSVARDVTADTIASLRRNIISEDVGAGLTVDFFPRLSLGGELGYTDFSDGNEKERYCLRSSYIFFFEPTLLQLSFLHEFENMEHGPNPGEPLADGFGPDDHPYYVPHMYWSNRLSLFFKHQLSDDTLGRGIPRYYTLEYAYGYDTRGENLLEMRSSFFVELSKNFIMKASAGTTELPSFRRRDLFISVAYRF